MRRPTEDQLAGLKKLTDLAQDITRFGIDMCEMRGMKSSYQLAGALCLSLKKTLEIIGDDELTARVLIMLIAPEGEEEPVKGEANG